MADDAPVDRPRYGRVLAGLFSVGVGVVFLLFGLMLPLRYFIAESENIWLLLRRMAGVAMLGLVLITAGRGILRP